MTSDITQKKVTAELKGSHMVFLAICSLLAGAAGGDETVASGSEPRGVESSNHAALLGDLKGRTENL